MKKLGLILCALLVSLCAVEARAQPASVTISFSPATITAGGESTLTIQIFNANTGLAISGGTIASFSYAAGVVNSTNVSHFNCGLSPTVTATPGAGSMSASNIDIALSQSCFIFIDVTASTGGSYTTTFPVGGFTSNTGPNAAASSATLTVNAPLVVTNANDSGTGSLRQALTDVNASCASGPWTIDFNIPGSAVISPASALPAISCDNTTVNGFSQPSQGTNPVKIDGSVCACNQLQVTGGSVLVKGLHIVNGLGVLINTVGAFDNVDFVGNVVSGNAAGISVPSGFLNLGDGTAAGANQVTGNTGDGIAIGASGGATIDLNTISGNGGSGIAIGDGFQDVFIFDTTVSGNGARGIGMSPGRIGDVMLLGTTSFGNGGPGFDLANDGPTANDEGSIPYDTDTGPNELLNYPVVTSVVNTGGNTVIQGDLKADGANRNSVIELFTSSVASTATVTEGETLIDSFNLLLDTNGFGTFTRTVSGTHTNVSARVSIDTCGEGCFVSSEYSPSVAAAPPSVTLAPATLTFAPRTVGTTSAAQTVTLTNSGSSDLVISSIGTTGDFGQTNTCPATLAASASCNISVTFTPLVVGARTGELKVFSNAAGSPHAVSLSGDGVAAPAPAVTLAPATLTFAPRTVGTTSAAQTVTLTNSGSSDLAISAIGTTGDFGQTNTCPATLAASASCNISVTFTPLAAGPRTGELKVFSNAAGSPHAVSLNGDGIAAVPAVTLAPATLTFAPRTVGTTSAAQTVTLTNSGSGDLAISAIGTTGDFGQTNTCPATLAASASCNISVTFTPLVVGPRTGELQVFSNAAGSPHAVSLSGDGLAAPAPVVTLAPATLTFAPRTVGTTSAAQTVTLTNSGSSDLAISAIGTTGDFGQTNTCPATLAASASCNISVTFTPLAAGPRTGELQVFSNATGSPHAVSLNGDGIAAVPAVTLAPATLTFAPRTVGTTSAAQTVTLTNSGSSDLLISAIGTTGDFGQTNTCPATLAASASCNISVTFTPLLVGPRTGELKVFSNAAGSPHAVSLSGDGLAAPAPVVTLTASSLAFPNTFVGATSAGQVIVLTNTGSAPLVIAFVAGNSEDFPFTTSCAGTLAPSASCDINAQFRPSAAGGRSGTISIHSNASGSPHAISLSGNGVDRPIGTLSASPTPVTFPNTVNGAQSAPVTVTISNTGGAEVAVSSITVSASFVLAGTCGTIAPAASCQVTVRFAPTQLGSVSGTLTVQSNATPPTVTVPLSGVSIANPLPEARLTPTSIGFGNRFVGGASSAQVVTLTNAGLAALTISGISTTGDFVQANNCPAALAPGASCQISVSMLAQIAGPRGGTLRVFTNAAESPAIVQLAGNGCRFVSLSRARLGVALSCVPGG